MSARSATVGPLNKGYDAARHHLGVAGDALFTMLRSNQGGIEAEFRVASGHENGTDFLLKRNVCRNVWNGQISVKSLKMERT